MARHDLAMDEEDFDIDVIVKKSQRKKFGTHLDGPHRVVDSRLEPGSTHRGPGVEYRTLTKARLACKAGQSYVRTDDSKVIGTK